MQGIEIPIGAPLGQLDKDLKGAESKLKGFAAEASKTAGVLGGSTVKGANSAAFAMQNLGRVAQDAPFGFIGIQNNLNPLLESFQRLKQETGSSSSALKALGQSLVGPAGLGIALSVVSAGLLFYQQYQQKANRETKVAVDANKELADSIKTIEQVQAAGRANASEDLSRLQSLYNATQNVNIPIKERLKIAEELIKQNPQYLKGLNAEEIIAGKAATAYQTLTNAILAKGLAQAGEANRGKLTNKFLEDSTSLLIAQQELRAAESKVRAKPTATLGLAAAQQANQLSNSFNDARSKVDELNGALKNTENQLKLNDQVTQDLIKKFGGDIVIDPEKIDKSNKELKTQAEILKALSIDYKQIAADQQLIGSDVFTEKIKATKKALNDLIGIGVSTDSGIIKKLQSDLATLNQAAFTFNLKPEADKFAEQLRLTLIQFKVDAALVADEAKLKLDFIDEKEIDSAEKSIKGLGDSIEKFLNKKTQKSVESFLTPFQNLSLIVEKEILPQLSTTFQTFFDDILMNGKLSFETLGQAIKKTFLSVLSNEATKGLLSLLSTGSKEDKKSGTPLITGIATLLGIGAKAAIAPVAVAAVAAPVAVAGTAAVVGTTAAVAGGTAAVAGGTAAALAPAAAASPLLPILAGIAAVALIANLFKKKKQAPIPQASSTISTSAAGSAQDFGGGRVIFEISGTNLIGVLNRAGAKLQRFGP